MEPTNQLETPDDMQWQQPVTEREYQNTSIIGLPVLGKRRHSSLSNDGDEVAAQDGASIIDRTTENVEQTLSRPTIGTLRERRAAASPEKFNKHNFQPLLPSNGEIDRPPAKKARLENRVEITYDSTGTPLLSSFRSSFPHGSLISEPQTSTGTTNAQLIINPTHPPAKKKPFNLLDAICRENDILLHFVSFLTIPSLISLYAISKPFHYLFNRHHTSFTLSVMRTWAPDADKIFPWHCYKDLCVKDPSKRQKERLEGKEGEVHHQWNDVRDVPSLRWLQMVIWRQGVCKDMCIQLAVNGVRSPPGTLDAIKRMWFIMDLPLNAHRIALMRTPSYISNKTLHMMTFFLLKVDMLFTDPVHPPFPANHPDQLRFPHRLSGGAPSGVPLRKMLLGERHLTPLWRSIRGWNWDPTQPQVPMTRLDMLRLWIRHRYSHPPGTPEHIKKQSIMSIPWWDVGTAGYERTGVSFFNLTDEKQIVLSHPSIAGTGVAENEQEKLLYPHRRRLVLANEKPREKLLRPDELVIRECIRRGMAMHKCWAKMMLHGFNDDAGAPLPVFTEEQYLMIGKQQNPFGKKRKVEDVEEQELTEETILAKADE